MSINTYFMYFILTLIMINSWILLFDIIKPIKNIKQNVGSSVQARSCLM